MGTRWLWLAVVAGCGGQGVLEIQVAAPASGLAIDQVEMFVGIHDATTEPIRPVQYRTAVDPMTWWARDRSADDLQAVDPGETLTFAYKGAGIESLVAVGFAGGLPVAAGTLLEPVEIPDNAEIHRYSIPLEAVDMLPRMPPALINPLGLQVWGPPADLHACVHVSSGGEDASIASKRDPDCDGLDDDDPLECATREYLGRLPLARADLSCVTHDAVRVMDMELDACVLGGSACIDGLARDPTRCDPSAYCVPQTVCEAAMGTNCNNVDCVLNGFLGGGVGYVECPVPHYINQSVDTMCERPLRVTLSDFSPGIACKTTAELRTAQQGFGPAVSYPGGGSIAIVSDTSCLLRLTPSGPFPLNTASVPGPFGAVVAVSLTAPQPGRGIAVPVVFRLGPQVSAAAACPATVVCNSKPEIASDVLSTCVNAPPAPGTAAKE